MFFDLRERGRTPYDLRFHRASGFSLLRYLAASRGSAVRAETP
jgi:hypothetical protein